jgi:hypothetical protein
MYFDTTSSSWRTVSGSYIVQNKNSVTIYQNTTHFSYWVVSSPSPSSSGDTINSFYSLGIFNFLCLFLINLLI